jgi:CheY-like chemotaxis protein
MTESRDDDDPKRDLKPPRKAMDSVSLARLSLKRALAMLPKGTASAGERKARESPMRLSLRADKPRILLVDDDAVVRRLMTKVIEGKGMCCVAAESAETAIPIMEKQLFNALVLDKNLPGMDGVELAGLARRIQPGVPVLMITGYASEESASQAAAFGVADYIRKPIDLQDFRKRLNTVLDADAGPGSPFWEQPEADVATEAVQEQADEEPAAAADPGEPPVGQEVSLLLVEPTDSTREQLEEALRPLGCVIKTFSEPFEALLRLGHHPFELLVAPPEVLSASRTWQPGGGWRLLGSIAIMDRGGVDKIIEAIQLGARGVVHPPFEADKTSAEIQRVVGALLEERDQG